jgi:hypothetical protein
MNVKDNEVLKIATKAVKVTPIHLTCLNYVVGSALPLTFVTKMKLLTSHLYCEFSGIAPEISQ